MDLSIITVTYNSKEYIADQIRSVMDACGGLIYEHIIVDNASQDGTVEYISKEFPDTRVISNTQNRGFARANNQGVEVSSAPFILFLNPDMKFIEAGALKKFVEWMRNQKKVGVAGCRLIVPNGEVNKEALPRCFPRLREMLLLIFKVPHLFPHVLGRYLMKGFDSAKEQEVDSVRGSCMLVRRELINQLGFAFDPRYFIWFEDVDLCREAKRLQWKVVYTPIISCIDLVGQSFKKKRLWWKQKQFIKSMWKYFWKWGISIRM